MKKSLVRMTALIMVFFMMLSFIPVNASADARVEIQFNEIPVLSVGESFQIPYEKINFAEDDVIHWSVLNNPDVVSVDQTGYVTALANGFALVRASLDNGNQSTARINVCPEIESLSFEDDPILVNLTSNQPRVTGLVIKPDEAYARISEITYTIADESIAKMQYDSIMPVAEGETTITAIAENGVKATAAVKVVTGDYADYIDSGWDSPLAIDHTNYMEIGDRLTIEPVMRSNSDPEKTEFADEKVTWAIYEGADIISIRTSGNNVIIDAKKNGRATLSAKLTNGQYAYYYVTVAPKVTKVEFDETKAYILPFVKWTGFNIKDYLVTEPEEAINRQYTVSSSDTGVIGGVFNPGITYVSMSGIGKTVITVTPTDDPSLAVTHEFELVDPSELNAPESIKPLTATEIDRYLDYYYPSMMNNLGDLAIEYSPEDCRPDTNWKSADTNIVTVKENWLSTGNVRKANVQMVSAGSTAVIASSKYNPALVQEFKVNVLEGDPEVFAHTSKITIQEDGKDETAENPESYTLEAGKSYVLKLSQDGKYIPSLPRVKKYFEELKTIDVTEVRPLGMLTGMDSVSQSVEIYFDADKPGTETVDFGDRKLTLVLEGSETDPDPVSIALDAGQTVNVGSTITLSAKVLPEEADQTVTWSVDKDAFASIDADGTLKGLKAGTVTVTAETVNGLKAECTVRVLFTDVPAKGKYYSDPVYWAVEEGITNGYKDKDGLSRTFRPQNNCTREAVVTFLWRLAGKPNPKSLKSPFTDVKDSSKYYYKAVLWAVEQGITKGYADGTFKPDETCLREHVVTFLYRYAGKPAPKTAKNPFNDVYKSDYYYAAAIWANENGIAKGYTSGAHAGGFGPKLDCLREHVVTFLYRYDQKFSQSK